MKRTGMVMKIIATMIWGYKMYEGYPFNNNDNWILMVFAWGLSIMIVQFFIAFEKDILN